MPVCPWQAPFHQLGSELSMTWIKSPRRNPSSPSSWGSKSKRAWTYVGCCRRGAGREHLLGLCHGQPPAGGGLVTGARPPCADSSTFPATTSHFYPPPPLFIFPGCRSTLRGSRLRSPRLPTGQNVLGLVRHGVEASAGRQGGPWATAARLWFTTPGLEKASVPIGLLLMKSLRFYGVERSRA